MACTEKNYKFIFIALLTLVFLLYSESSFAETTILNDVTKRYKDVAVGWAGTMKVAATFLFYSLGAISLAWTLGMLIIRRAEIGEVFGELIKFGVFFGFMNWLLRNVSQIGAAIVSSLKQLATNAGGNTSTANASDILGTGYDLMTKIGDSLSMTSPIDSLAALIVGLLVLIALCIVAVNFVVTEISAYIVLYGGIFVLGFGGSRWTSDIAINYYKSLIGIGLQLMTIILLVGIGKEIITTYVAQMSKGDVKFEELIIVLISAIFLMMLINKIPPMVGGLITGATGSTNFGGAGMALAGMVASMAAATTALVASAAALGKIASANVLGAGQSLSEAMKSSVGDSDKQDTTPDLASSFSNKEESSPVQNAKESQNIQGNSGQDGHSGEMGNQGDPGQDGTTPETNAENDFSNEKQTKEKAEDTTPGVNPEHAASSKDSSIVQQPRTFAERAKSAISSVGTTIRDDLRQSVHDFGANSYMGRVAEKIKTSSTHPPEGTGSISSGTNVEQATTSGVKNSKLSSSAAKFVSNLEKTIDQSNKW